MESRTSARLSVITFFITVAISVPINAQVTGNGSPGFVPVWTGSTTPSSTLGNATILQNPASGLNGIGTQISSGTGRAAVCRGIPGDGTQCTSGGTGGLIQITAAGGGASTCVSSACGRAGNGGSISLQPGGAGLGSGNLAGQAGNIILVPSFGRVGIGLVPAHTLEVKAGGTTLADAWTIRSSRRSKTNIEPIKEALQKVQRLQGVSYLRKSDGEHEIGVVAEDVALVVPEVVSRDPDKHEIEGVDYSKLTALLIEAIKSQQNEIRHLKGRIDRLTSSAGDHSKR